MRRGENAIKTRLLKGDLQIGAFLGLGGTAATEIAGQAGFDWCLIDGEHAPFGVSDIRDQLVGLAAVGCPAVVRVPCDEDWVLKRVLDIGAQTILVPMVNNAAQAASIAAAVRYPPGGRRGLAAAIVRASHYGAQPDYAQTADDQICLIVQAESSAAVDNIDAIAATEGVDCVFIGPSDLAADMGHLGQSGAPEVAEAIEHLITRTIAAGKAAGIFCLDPAQLGHYRDLGARFIAVGSDVAALRGALSETAATAQARLA